MRETKGKDDDRLPSHESKSRSRSLAVKIMCIIFPEQRLSGEQRQGDDEYIKINLNDKQREENTILICYNLPVLVHTHQRFERASGGMSPKVWKIRNKQNCRLLRRGLGKIKIKMILRWSRAAARNGCRAHSSLSLGSVCANISGNECLLISLQSLRKHPLHSQQLNTRSWRGRMDFFTLSPCAPLHYNFFFGRKFCVNKLFERVALWRVCNRFIRSR
jgi:hypothetical protein